MSLSLYKKKRNFSETPEPAGKEKTSKGALRFVIQKHDASNLHYDFRLEMEGVLKSWAVPKGPSLNPADKRLAMMVEDHPYDYRTFEGIIPEGNYGAGTVMVWDEGYYEPLEADGKSKKEQDKMLLSQLHKGSIKIRMHGKKLKGEFALVKIKSDESGKSWLLIKHNDGHAKEIDITTKNKSVISNKTLAKIAAENGSELKHPEEKKALAKASKVSRKAAAVKTTSKNVATKKQTSKKSATGKKKVPALKSLLGKSFSLVQKSTMPTGIKPMLATLADDAFDDENWLYEIKWDGYRALANVQEGKVKLVSRNNKPFTERYTPVTDSLAALPFNAVLDGEIIAVNEKGMAEFQLMQNWQSAPDTPLQFYIFDIIWLNGYDLTSLPLIERKNLLEEILPKDDDVIKYSSHIMESGKAFFEAAMEQGLEGIMAKRSNSRYTIGNRSADWLKIKVNQRQEVVIAGYTEPRNTRKHFGALILGIYDGDDLVYVGHTGSGFNEKKLDEIYGKLKKLETKKVPFKTKPKTNMPVTWVKPELVCEIKFTEWTKDRIARHPIFMGLRDDKKPKEVVFEKAKTISSIKPKEMATPKKATAKKSTATKAVTRKKAAPAKQSKRNSNIQLSIDDGKEQKIVLNKHELKLTNLDKYYWKKEKVRKMDMINYYLQIAPYMMPYMKDRPQSLNRHPNGIEGQNFYQKDMGGKVPEWMQLHRDFSESTQSNVDYLVCSNEATLIYMANLGCIEMHPWHSRMQSWESPDWCLIDLDPSDGNSFQQVIDTAQVVKQVLDSIGAEACVKTSGSSGIHIYIPLGAKYDFDQSKQLAELVVTLVHWELPEFTSLERSPAKRKGKIYLDYLQNRQTQTAAAPYSLRPKPGAPVSTPLHWDEVKKGLIPTTYHINNIMDRLKVEGDLFKPVLGKGINLDKVLKKVSSLMG